MAEREQPVGVGIGFHPMFTGGGVDLADEAVRNEPRVARLELADPGDDLALKIARDAGGDAVKIHLARRAHRAEFQLVQAVHDRRLRGLRDAGDGFRRRIGAGGHHKNWRPTFRSLIPESVAGIVPGTKFDSWSLGFDQKLPRETYFGVNAELLMSDGARDVGAFSNSIPFIPVLNSMTSARQILDYREQNFSAYLTQLIGRDWAVGARYRVSEAKMETQLPGFAGISGASSLDQNQRAVLQHGQLFLIYNHPCGFFAGRSSDWYHQQNQGDLSGQPGADFWRHNFFAGYVFPHRRAEIRLGLLNLADQNYRLNPLNLQSELARRRTFTASLRLNY